MLWQKKGKVDITGDRIPAECGRETKRRQLRNARSVFLFLSFRRVLNVIYSFLGNSPASEF